MNKPNLNVHFNAPSVRFDAWGQLRNAAAALSRTSEATPQFATIREKIDTVLNTLTPMESLMGYPGKDQFGRLAKLYQEGDYPAFCHAICETGDLLESGAYQRSVIEKAVGFSTPDIHYCEVLVVLSCSAADEQCVRAELCKWQSHHDRVVYNVVVVNSFEDALLAVMLNDNIQACIIHDDFAMESKHSLQALEGLKKNLAARVYDAANRPVFFLLGDYIHQLRPEIDLFLSTVVSPEQLASDVKSCFNRIFYRHESSSELHLSIIKAIGNRYETPFFDAVKKYSREPVGTFHALPIARGNSVFQSPWLKDFHEFYGSDIFLAESSATTGGLDSILQPTGTLKEAQEKASECYGSRRTLFVTAGTSTANKIVHQAVTRPGDIVLIDRSAHESHHFALLLTGASPYYLESYTLDKYSIAGAVQLESIKRTLIDLAKKGLLHRVKMVVLTNCTFDGLTYNVQRYMKEILAIKPDVIFLWDEAWFAFARFVPHYRQRTGMHAASVLFEQFQSEAYRNKYEEFKNSFLAEHSEPDDNWITQELMPDPDAAKVRVYTTQSTHKTLSSFRQGSMIHVYDELCTEETRDQLTKSYFTHTTTSPNYQILASLDVSRRQVHLEGYQLVQRQIEMALLIRNTINSHPLLNRYFQALGPSELIPDEYRESEVGTGYDASRDWESVALAWEVDDFVLDPCRINVYTAKTGISGFTLRTEYLAKQYNIQVNKTGLNTFCLMTNIGTTRSSVAYLIDCLIQIAEECERRDKRLSAAERAQFQQQRDRVTELPPLPDFTGFHPKFLLDRSTAAGLMREAFFEGYDGDHIEYFKIDELGHLLESGRELVGATFVVPVPPGYPLIAPGQLIKHDTVTFLQALNAHEILGLDTELGVRVFRESYFEQTKRESTDGREKREPATASALPESE